MVTKKRAIEMINSWIKSDMKIIFQNYHNQDLVAYYREAIECYRYVLKILKGENDGENNS